MPDILHIHTQLVPQAVHSLILFLVGAMADCRYFLRGTIELTTLGNFGRTSVNHNHDGADNITISGKGEVRILRKGAASMQKDLGSCSKQEAVQSPTGIEALKRTGFGCPEGWYSIICRSIKSNLPGCGTLISLAGVRD